MNKRPTSVKYGRPNDLWAICIIRRLTPFVFVPRSIIFLAIFYLLIHNMIFGLIQRGESVSVSLSKKKNSKTVGRCSNTKVHCTPMRFYYRLTMFALRMMFHTYLDDLLFHYLGAWAFLLILFVENNIFLCYRLLLYNSNLNIY